MTTDRRTTERRRPTRLTYLPTERERDGALTLEVYDERGRRLGIIYRAGDHWRVPSVATDHRSRDAAAERLLQQHTRVMG